MPDVIVVAVDDLQHTSDRQRDHESLLLFCNEACVAQWRDSGIRWPEVPTDPSPMPATVTACAYCAGCGVRVHHPLSCLLCGGGDACPAENFTLHAFRRPPGFLPGDVVDDGIHDPDEMVAFIDARTAIAADVIRRVLELYDEHLMLADILPIDPDYVFRYYDPSIAHERRIADPNRVASDAPALIGVSVEDAHTVLEGEYAYLVAKGFAG